jgi:23S rRNA (uracil1939-C5)-methyltransferase
VAVAELKGPGSSGQKTDAPAIAHIEAIDQEGRGVAHIDGKAIFIDGALPGETVRVHIQKRRKSYDLGRVLEITEASPERVTPRCIYFGVCGGCSLQHLRPEAQLPAKELILRDNLARIGKVQPDTWLAGLSGPYWGYRRKARLGARLVEKKGGVIVGFREKRRHVVPLTEADLALLETFGRQHDLQIFAQPGRPDQLVPVWPTQPAPLVYRLPDQDVELEFAPTDFIQVNAALNQRMVARALELLNPAPTESVLDLFCGLGNFTLPLARRAGRVLGIEADQTLIEKARRNAQRNGIANAAFLVADLRDPDVAHPWEEEHFDKWLLDPPRTGAMELVKRLPTDGGPGSIVYISCNPSTLARDSEVLVHAKGYRLAAAGVMDMFPQTSHVEAMALFER